MSRVVTFAVEREAMTATPNAVREASLYPLVERWARKHFRLYTTSVNTGLRAGRIDIVGLRHVGGDLTGTSEVVAIEVKAGRQPFATAAGQAHAYSVYAERCYLADIRAGGYTVDEIEIASRLGIGLITIAKNRLREILTAPHHEPVARLRLELCERMGYSRCTICGSLFQRGSKYTDWRKVRRASTRAGILQAAADEKGYVYWLEESSARAGRITSEGAIYHRRYVCPDCVANLFGELAD
jgi:hypothetical protein